MRVGCEFLEAKFFATLFKLVSKSTDFMVGFVGQALCFIDKNNPTLKWKAIDNFNNH